jgi:GH43 family beta-xylosidase
MDNSCWNYYIHCFEILVRWYIYSAAGKYNAGATAYFDSSCDEYMIILMENRYSNSDSWVENAARKKGK